MIRLLREREANLAVRCLYVDEKFLAHAMVGVHIESALPDGDEAGKPVTFDLCHHDTALVAMLGERDVLVGGEIRVNAPVVIVAAAAVVKEQIVTMLDQSGRRNDKPGVEFARLAEFHEGWTPFRISPLESVV